jgi:protein SCO1
VSVNVRRSLRWITACAVFAALVSAGVASGSAKRIPNVRVRNQRNEEVRFYDDLVKGRIVLINVMFTTCTTLCPRSTDNLVRVQKELARRGATGVSLISLSVDPEHDTPDVLASYAAEHHAGADWNFVTGSRADIDMVRRALGVYDDDNTAHSAMLIYGDDTRGSWAGMPVMATPAAIVTAVLRFVELRRVGLSR